MNDPTSTASALRWWGLTHPGKVRANNEDAFLAVAFDRAEVRFLGKVGAGSLVAADYVFAVSDGMGGAKSGEFASRIAVDKITQLLPRSFRARAQGRAPDFQDVLPELYSAIHRELGELARCYEECAGMGATLTLAWCAPGWLYFAHIGDSRLYYLPAGGEGSVHWTGEEEPEPKRRQRQGSALGRGLDSRIQLRVPVGAQGS